MSALLSLVGLLYTFDTLLQFLSGLALTWCGLGLLGGEDQLGGLNRDVAGDSGVDLLVPGCAMWFSMIMWGTCVVFIPMKELRGKNRHRLMKTQSGHTGMLTYFLSLGPTMELARFRQGSSGQSWTANNNKLRRIIKLHAFLGVAQALLRYFYKDATLRTVEVVIAGTKTPDTQLVSSLLRPTCVLLDMSMFFSLGLAGLALLAVILTPASYPEGEDGGDGSDKED